MVWVLERPTEVNRDLDAYREGDVSLFVITHLHYSSSLRIKRDAPRRFSSSIPLLADPARHGGEAADAFDVVVPSFPGFGFSDPKAMSEEAIGDLLVKLMRELGYPKFLVSGGDKGSMTAMAMARKRPDAVQGGFRRELAPGA
jgi:pimeloyl-ACP methyl ester carboxylesterase